MALKTARRLTAVVLVLAGLAPGTRAQAQPPSTSSGQAFPTKPIRMVIPYTPGGPTDLVGRALAQRLQAAFGQQVVVDNRAGAGGVIAVEIVAKGAREQ